MRRVLLFLALVVPVFSGCHKKPSVVVPPTPPAKKSSVPSVPNAITPPPTISLEPVPIDKTIAAPSNLELGEMNFQVGNYQLAAKELEAYLKNNPQSKNRDRILYELGLSRALAPDSGRNMRQAQVMFRRLIAEFPKSTYANQAEFILGLQAQIEKLRDDVKERDEKIKKLSEELQVLKEIDLQRRPSRPKE